MKKLLGLTLLALAVLAFTERQALAWSHTKLSIGLNFERIGGGNSLFWGLARGQQPPPGMFGGPGPIAPYGFPGGPLGFPPMGGPPYGPQMAGADPAAGGYAPQYVGGGFGATGEGSFGGYGGGYSGGMGPEYTGEPAAPESKGKAGKVSWIQPVDYRSTWYDRSSYMPIGYDYAVTPVRGNGP